MAFFFGDKDVAAAKAANSIVAALKSGTSHRDTTKARPVKNTKPPE